MQTRKKLTKLAPHRARTRTTARGLVAGIAATVAAVLLAGCTAATHPDANASPAPSATSINGLPTGVSQVTSIPTAIPNTAHARAVVKMTSCQAASHGWAASGSITNPGSQPKKTTITVFFTTSSATVIGTTQTSMTVPAGKSRTWTARAAFTPAPKTLCVLRGAG